MKMTYNKIKINLKTITTLFLSGKYSLMNSAQCLLLFLLKTHVTIWIK